MGKSVCVVCEYGWIIKGEVSGETESTVSMKESAVVRRWTNEKGIGGIVKEANKGGYILDPIGDVEIMKNKVLFSIPCEW